MYTKGEWSVHWAQPYDEHEFEVSYDYVEGADVLTYPIADVHGKLEYGDAEANANLIAAAPDMYEALKEAFEYSLSKGNDSLTIKIKQALAKAVGK